MGGDEMKKALQGLAVMSSENIDFTYNIIEQFEAIKSQARKKTIIHGLGIAIALVTIASLGLSLYQVSDLLLLGVIAGFSCSLASTTYFLVTLLRSLPYRVEQSEAVEDVRRKSGVYTRR
jgi:hypothetical protein